MTKLQKKLKRQARAQERALTFNTVSNMRSTSRNSSFYKQTHADFIKL